MVRNKKRRMKAEKETHQTGSTENSLFENYYEQYKAEQEFNNRIGEIYKPFRELLFELHYLSPKSDYINHQLSDKILELIINNERK